MATDDERIDPTVKQLLEARSEGANLSDVVDAAAQAELARWFSLPSFDQVGARAKPAEDPELVEVLERRAKALASIDPALVEQLRVRAEDKTEALVMFAQTIEVRVDPSVALLDLKMIERSIAEPREVEVSDELKDDLRDCTPQALLRDLHRPELEFEKTFEIVDMAAAQRMDIVAEVASAMATSWKLPPLGESPYVESRQLLEGVRRDRRGSWAEQARGLPNRKVTE